MNNIFLTDFSYDMGDDNSTVSVNLSNLDYDTMINGLNKLGWRIEIHAPVFYLGITKKPFGEYKCVLHKDGIEITTSGRYAKEAVYKASLMSLEIDGL